MLRNLTAITIYRHVEPEYLQKLNGDLSYEVGDKVLHVNKNWCTPWSKDREWSDYTHAPCVCIKLDLVANDARVVLDTTEQDIYHCQLIDLEKMVMIREGDYIAEIVKITQN